MTIFKKESASILIRTVYNPLYFSMAGSHGTATSPHPYHIAASTVEN